MRTILILATLAGITGAAPAIAMDQVSREDDIVGLRLGQRVWVDDGSCPTGQIKEVTGATLAAGGGVARVKKCVPRSGARMR